MQGRIHATDADIAAAQRACTDGETLLSQLRGRRQGMEADIAAAQRGLTDSEAALDAVKARHADVDTAVRCWGYRGTGCAHQRAAAILGAQTNSQLTREGSGGGGVGRVLLAAVGLGMGVKQLLWVAL